MGHPEYSELKAARGIHVRKSGKYWFKDPLFLVF